MMSQAQQMNSNQPTAVPAIVGVVHGKTIVLESDANLPDGQRVSVEVRPLPEEAKRPWGEGIRASAGALADEPEDLETTFAFFRSLRQNDRPPIEP